MDADTNNVEYDEYLKRETQDIWRLIVYVYVCMDTRPAVLLLHHVALFCIQRIKHHLPGDSFALEDVKQ